MEGRPLAVYSNPRGTRCGRRRLLRRKSPATMNGPIRIDLIPIHAAPSENAGKVPYLDIEAEDTPIDFLFTLNEKYGLIAAANLHTLKGAPKTGKSAAGLALITAALKGEFIGIKSNRENMSVLWIDTEQDKNTLRQKAKAVLSMAELDAAPETLKVVTLRGYGSPADALAATLQAIEDNAADFVFLDGVVDLCQAFNDEEKSRDAVRQLEAHAEKYGAAILGLIHTNKKDNEARGHLGAIMQQKSAEIYQVDKSGDTANVTQPLSRFAPVPGFSFAFDEAFKITAAADVLEKVKTELRNTFAGLFKESKTLTKSELVEAYKTANGCEDSKAEKDIKTAKDSGILQVEKKGRKSYYSYLFPVIPPYGYEDDDVL